MYIFLLFAYCFVICSKPIAWGMAATLGGPSAFSILTVGICMWGNWPICPGLKQICGGWYGVRPWGVLSDLEG